MRDLLVIVIHLLATVARLLCPGGARAVASESLLLKHQLQISGRTPQRAPNLTTLDRFVFAKHYETRNSGSNGRSWLIFLAQSKNCL